jgi:hypothetical protein
MTRRGPIYALHLQAKDDSVHGLRAVLKDLRRHGLRCLSIEPFPPSTGARRRSPRRERRQEKTKMDMRKFSGEHFYKVDDVRDGPIKEQIAAVKLGKYDKPNLVFESGSILSLNATNNAALLRAYGRNSVDWISKEIELFLGEVEYQGEMQEGVRLRPISPATPKTPLPAPEQQTPEKTATKPATAKPIEADIGEDIPF